MNILNSGGLQGPVLSLVLRGRRESRNKFFRRVQQAAWGAGAFWFRPQLLKRFVSVALLDPALFIGSAAWNSGPVRAATLPPGFVETAIGGTWNEAVGLTFDGRGRMYVCERGGRVWIVENGVRLPQPFIDLHEEVGGWREFDGHVNHFSL